MQSSQPSRSSTSPFTRRSRVERNSSYADTLNDLDKVQEKEDTAEKEVAKPNAAPVLTPFEGFLAVLAASQAFLLLVDAPANNWSAILAVLVTTAVVLLGVDTVMRIGTELLTGPSTGKPWHRVPLTDAVLEIGTINKFANSCQVREKGLKIVQYIFKLGAYSKIFSKDVGGVLKSLSKTTSIARRFFKFCRWVKHFEDYKAAKDEAPGLMRWLLYLRVAANLGADWAEDICSLERIGFLPKGTLSVEFMLFAEYCQLVLALIEIGISAVMVRKQQEVSELAEEKKRVAQQRKLALMRLELVKFVSDIGKAIFDCELHFAHEGVFIGCSLFSALVSTHKNMVKVLK